MSSFLFHFDIQLNFNNSRPKQPPWEGHFISQCNIWSDHVGKYSYPLDSFHVHLIISGFSPEGKAFMHLNLLGLILNIFYNLIVIGSQPK